MVDINISLLAPLILILVTALTNTSREVELIEVSNNAKSEVYLLRGDFVDKFLRRLFNFLVQLSEYLFQRERAQVEVGNRAKLGRFNHIHGFNSVLLGLLLTLTALSESSLSGFVLAVAISAFWIVLPVLEVNEYDEMMQQFDPEDSIRSLSFHMLATSCICLLPIISSYVNLVPIILSHVNLDMFLRSYDIFVAVGILIYVAIVIAVGTKFQLLLRNEIDVLQESDSGGTG